MILLGYFFPLCCSRKYEFHMYTPLAQGFFGFNLLIIPLEIPVLVHSHSFLLLETRMWNSKTYIILFQKERKTVLTIKLQESGGVYRICHVALMYSYFLHNYSIHFTKLLTGKVCCKFHKFALNLGISLLNCQSNGELWNELGNFVRNFVGINTEHPSKKCVVHANCWILEKYIFIFKNNAAFLETI